MSRKFGQGEMTFIPTPSVLNTHLVLVKLLLLLLWLLLGGGVRGKHCFLLRGWRLHVRWKLTWRAVRDRWRLVVGHRRGGAVRSRSVLLLLWNRLLLSMLLVYKQNDPNLSSQQKPESDCKITRGLNISSKPQPAIKGC